MQSSEIVWRRICADADPRHVKAALMRIRLSQRIYTCVSPRGEHWVRLTVGAAAELNVAGLLDPEY
jgi:hypothetical protein